MYSAIVVNLDGKSLQPVKFLVAGYLLLIGFIGLRNDPWTYLTCGPNCIPWETQVTEANSGLRREFIFWPMHSDPQFTSAVQLEG
jgi:hypothetical protein